MYFFFGAVYIALCAVFVIDVLRQPASALSGFGKAIWILALLFVPILAWIVYGFWRIQRSRL